MSPASSSQIFKQGGADQHMDRHAAHSEVKSHHPPASALTGCPTAALILSQCRSRMPGFRSAVMSGMCCWNACSCCRTASATSRGAPVSCLSSFALLRHHLQAQTHPKCHDQVTQQLLPAERVTLH